MSGKFPGSKRCWIRAGPPGPAVETGADPGNLVPLDRQGMANGPSAPGREALGLFLRRAGGPGCGRGGAVGGAVFSDGLTTGGDWPAAVQPGEPQLLQITELGIAQFVLRVLEKGQPTGPGRRDAIRTSSHRGDAAPRAPCVSS